MWQYLTHMATVGWSPVAPRTGHRVHSQLTTVAATLRSQGQLVHTDLALGCVSIFLIKMFICTEKSEFN